MTLFNTEEDIEGEHPDSFDEIMEEIRLRRLHRGILETMVVEPIMKSDIEWVFSKVEPIMRKHADPKRKMYS